jgi:membrane complex biogenesis BtpA family protein
MNSTADLFATYKPIVAMIHLAALPGASVGGEALPHVLDRAVQEARQLTEAGFDALLVQNTGDVPASHEGDEATVAFMTRIAGAIQENTDLPLGVNVLMNGSRASLAIAQAVEASFVRLKIVVGTVVTSTGMVSADPHGVLSFRQRIGASGVAILADVYDRTSAPVGDMPLEVMADLAVRHGGADGLVIAGYSVDDTLARLRTLRRTLPSTRLLVGGGAKPGNLQEMMEVSDGIIVGSAYKTGGHFLDPVDPEKAAAFMAAANEARQQLSQRSED